MLVFVVPTVTIIAGGTIDVGDNENNRKHKWLEVVRQLYQQAWHSDRNELMIAWAKSSPYMKP